MAIAVRSAWAVLIAITLGGCTSPQAMQGTPAELQQGIARGGALHVSDRVRITTADGRMHELTVSAVGNDSVAGGGEVLPLTTIVAVEKRIVNRGKTVGRVAIVLGALLGAALIVLIAISAGHVAFMSGA
jgi:hypothetical protein